MRFEVDRGMTTVPPRCECPRAWICFFLGLFSGCGGDPKLGSVNHGRAGEWIAPWVAHILCGPLPFPGMGRVGRCRSGGPGPQTLSRGGRGPIRPQAPRLGVFLPPNPMSPAKRQVTRGPTGSGRRGDSADTSCSCFCPRDATPPNLIRKGPGFAMATPPPLRVSRSHDSGLNEARDRGQTTWPSPASGLEGSSRQNLQEPTGQTPRLRVNP